MAKDVFAFIGLWVCIAATQRVLRALHSECMDA